MQYLYMKTSININLFIRRAVITGPRFAVRHLFFVDRINLSLGVNVFVSERAPSLMMQLLLQTRH
jgi:hypothetical protein